MIQTQHPISFPDTATRDPNPYSDVNAYSDPIPFSTFRDTNGYAQTSANTGQYVVLQPYSASCYTRTTHCSGPSQIHQTTHCSGSGQPGSLSLGINSNDVNCEFLLECLVAVSSCRVWKYVVVTSHICFIPRIIKLQLISCRENGGFINDNPKKNPVAKPPRSTKKKKKGSKSAKPQPTGGQTDDVEMVDNDIYAGATPPASNYTEVNPKTRKPAETQAASANADPIYEEAPPVPTKAAGIDDVQDEWVDNDLYDHSMR